MELYSDVAIQVQASAQSRAADTYQDSGDGFKYVWTQQEIATTDTVCTLLYTFYLTRRYRLIVRCMLS
jgi:hypothetical protein